MSWRIPASVAWTESPNNDSIGVVDVRSGRVVVLSATAGAIWQAAQDAADKAELLARLVDEFAVDASDIDADVEKCVNDLMMAGLLTNDELGTAR